MYLLTVAALRDVQNRYLLHFYCAISNMYRIYHSMAPKFRFDSLCPVSGRAVLKPGINYRIEIWAPSNDIFWTATLFRNQDYIQD